jgi:hypothetical protein
MGFAALARLALRPRFIAAAWSTVPGMVLTAVALPDGARFALHWAEPLPTHGKITLSVNGVDWSAQSKSGMRIALHAFRYYLLDPFRNDFETRRYDVDVSFLPVEPTGLRGAVIDLRPRDVRRLAIAR